MDRLTDDGDRVYVPLPIDGSRGFPQAFPLLFDGRSYHFRLYVNVAPARLADPTAVLELPSTDAFLVVQVEVEASDGTRAPLLIRKVAPEQVYETGAIALRFPEQRVAIRNLNGQGEFGSRVTGGIAPRWA
jgi:hypothetical protein